jgi:uncharacterized protein YraI
MDKKRSTLAAVALIFALLACNMPSGQEINAAVTALAQTGTALALTAQPGGQPAGVATATTAAPPAATVAASLAPTACTGFVTANLNANVRNGPGTAYGAIGALLTGQTAPIAGKSGDGSWWYIAFAGGPGGYGWIAQSVTTATCVPAVVPVIPAPPLPPTVVPSATTAPPAAFAVTHVGFAFSTWGDAGHVNCPRVTASIQTNGPGTVTYHWTRSDGGSNPTATLTFGSAGTQSINYDWALGSVWNGQTFWVGIYIDDPNHQDFGHKTFTQACTSP